ncbi:MAG: dienelactone hydrolase family protein [Pseudomonadota bacterium]
MMRSLAWLPFALSAAAVHAENDFNVMTINHSVDGTDFVSTVVWDAETTDPMPGVLMVPNWMGPTEASLKKAKQVAEEGYVVMMVDMYGVDVRPQNAQEAGAAAGAVRSDRAVMRARANNALETFRALPQQGSVPLDSARVAAIGFCFGGGTVLELARSGTELDAVVSFHGDLLSPTLAADSANIQSKVLVLHGAADPYVPQDHVSQFVDVMNATDVDWQLMQFGGAVHSFTDPLAQSEGARYDAVVSARAFEVMDELFEELWEQADGE